MRKRHVRVMLAGVVFSMTLCLLLFGSAPAAKGANRIHFIAMGYGNATLVESNGHYALIDAGEPTDETCKKVGAEPQEHRSDLVTAYLDDLGITHLDVVIISHEHYDHNGGIPEIAEKYCDENTVCYYRGIYRTDEDIRNPEYCNYEFQRYAITCMRRAGAKCVSIYDENITSLSLKLGSFKLTFCNIGDYDGDGHTDLLQSAEDSGDNFSENNNTMAVLVTGVGGIRTLIAGDIHTYAEGHVAEEVGHVDILQVPHHGAMTSSSPEFLAALHPSTAITFHNTASETFPNLGAYAYLAENGCELYWTANREDSGRTCTGARATVITYRSSGYEVTGNIPKKVPQYTGWKRFNSKTVYLVKGVLQKNWLKWEGSWYYLDPDTGVYRTGFVKVGGKCYYLRKSGAWLTGSGWQKLEGRWYYLKADSTLATGWLPLDGQWYYLDADTGAMQTGWTDIAGKRYYLETGTGILQKGWIKVDGNWYYMGPTTGAMQTGWITVDGERYYTDPDSGILQKGWVKDSGKWYYMDPADGTLQTGWLKVSGKWYYMDPKDGAMSMGWVKDSGKWYYMDPTDGTLQTGWLKVSGKWYYLDPTSGAMVTGWKKLSGKWYYLDPASGAMKTGLQTIGGKTYYLDKKSGAMKTDCDIDGWHFSKSGAGTKIG